MRSYVIKKAQRGFAMLEVLLAVIVIAMVSFGVYQLYSSSSESSQAANFEQIAQQVMSAAAQYGATTFAAPADQTDLIDGGYLPDKIINGTNVVGPYGNIELKSTNGGPQDFQLSAANVPASQGQAICNSLNGSYDVSMDGSTQLASCSDADWGSSGNTFTIYLDSPKGALTA